MFCSQERVCYNKSEEIAPELDIREKIKFEILNLSDKQAEYVLRRMLETNE